MKIPQNTGAEEALLSCLIDTDMDHTNLLSCQQAGITPAHFHLPLHQVLYEAALDLHSEEAEVEILGLWEVIKSKGQAKICNASDISRVSGVAETDAPFENAKEAVLTTASQRKALESARQMVARLEEDYRCREDVQAAVNPHAARLGNALKSADRVRAIDDIIDDAVANKDNRISGKVFGQAVSFGIDAFDRIATPIESHELVLIAARPSEGKSSLSRQIAHANVRSGRKTAAFVLETSDTSFVEACAAEIAQVSVRGIHKELPEKQRLYAKELDRARGYRDLLRVYDKDLTLTSIEARCKILKAVWRPTLVVIDYLQLIQHSAPNRSRTDELGEVTRVMVSLVKHMECPIILMSQLSRGVEREHRLPVLSDMRDSGSIESDATRVIFVHTPARDIKGAEQVQKDLDSYTKLLIQAKLRDGPKAKLDVRFQSKWATFEQL